MIYPEVRLTERQLKKKAIDFISKYPFWKDVSRKEIEQYYDNFYPKNMVIAVYKDRITGILDMEPRFDGLVVNFYNMMATDHDIFKKLFAMAHVLNPRMKVMRIWKHKLQRWMNYFPKTHKYTNGAI